jgi:hypothetical protein
MTRASEARMERPPRLFTLAEADALLPVARIALAAMRREIALLRKLVPSLGFAMPVDLRLPFGDMAVPTSYADTVRRLLEVHEDLRRRGVWVKGVEEGLLDFPTAHGTRVVLLCWKEGEESIGWFHDLHAGFAGRRPLSELSGAPG